MVEAASAQVVAVMGLELPKRDSDLWKDERGRGWTLLKGQRTASRSVERPHLRCAPSWMQ